MAGKTTLGLIIIGLTLLASMAGPIRTANALPRSPQPIDAPLPEDWRAPLEAFLTKQYPANRLLLRPLGIDVQAALNGTRTAKLPVWTGNTPRKLVESVGLLLQINSRDTCFRDGDTCLTIVGRVDNGTFVADIMFFAGTKANEDDVLVPLSEGYQKATMFFHSRDIVVALDKLPIGWTLSAWPQIKPTK